MYNAIVLDHFQNPRNSGELPPPAISVEAANPVCGDVLRLWLRAEAGRVSAVRFQAKGCAASIAAASLLTTLIEGKTTQEAALVRAEQIAKGLGGLPVESGHAAVLAKEALTQALRAAAAPPR